MLFSCCFFLAGIYARRKKQQGNLKPVMTHSLSQSLIII